MFHPYAEFYRYWLPISPVAVPPEQALDCRNCAMVTPLRAGGPTRDTGPFRADLKCCTYFPFLPNFTVGALLMKGDGRVQNALKNGIATPLGLFPPPDRASLRFGQDVELLWPFFERGSRTCSIWNHRPGVCSSYVCQSSMGSAGLQSWAQLEERLNLFEWTLAHEVLWRMGFTSNETEAIASLKEVEKSWSEHRDRKLEFYRDCFDRSRSVTPAEITTLMC